MVKEMKTMDDNNKVSQQELEQVSGGNSGEMQELMEFIRKHDPNFKVWNSIDVRRFLLCNSTFAVSQIRELSEFINTHRCNRQCVFF